MDVVETLMLMSLKWAAVVLGVLALCIVIKNILGAKHKKKLEQSDPVTAKAGVGVKTPSLVITESNVVSMEEFRAKRNLNRTPLTVKVRSKETKIIYPLRNR